MIVEKIYSPIWIYPITDGVLIRVLVWAVIVERDLPVMYGEMNRLEKVWRYGEWAVRFGRW